MSADRSDQRRSGTVIGLRIIVAVIVSLWLGVMSASPALAGFQPRQEYGAPGQPYAVAGGDFNSDAKPDLVIASFASDSVYVLLGNGDGTLQAAHSIKVTLGGAPCSCRSAAVADLNGDGKLDIVVTMSVNKTYAVLLGNGNGTFQDVQTIDSAVETQIVVLADLNGDAKLDIIAATGTTSVSSLLGNGNGTFQESRHFTAEWNPSGVAVIDFNADGRLDVAVTSLDGDWVSVLLGNGDGTFQARQSFAAGDGPTGVAAADFNADGKPDVAVSNTLGDAISVLLGNGDGTLRARQTFAAGDATSSVKVADVNSDGKLDLLATSHDDDTVMVFLGNGDGTFQTPQGFAVGDGPGHVAVLDLNADGELDVVATTRISNKVSVLLGIQNGVLQFGAPTMNVDERGAATVTVTRTGGTNEQVSVIVSLTGGTAAQGQDFTFAAPRTVTWFHGESTPKTVVIPIADDVVIEPNETVQLALTLPSAESWPAIGSQSTTTFTITDDDTLPAVSIADASVAEGNSGTATMAFPVTLAASSGQAISVQYASANGSATAGTDYTATSGTLSFAAGETSKTISVPVLGDTTVETAETLTVTLSNPTNAILGTAQATGTIGNDDAEGTNPGPGPGPTPGDPCSPRPGVITTTTAGGDALRARIESLPLSTQQPNPIQQIRFGTFQNAVVTLNGQPVSGGQSVALPAGTTTLEVTVRRAAPAQPTTVPMIVVDGCGEWPTFIGGGAGAGF